MKQKQRTIYFIQEHLSQSYFNGGIGNMDIEKILLKEGAIPVSFPCHFDFSVKAKWTRFLYLIKTFCTLPKGSVVIFQHPMYAGMNKLLIRLLRLRPSVKKIIILAEINGLKYADKNILKQEIAFFRNMDYFIVHNKPMRQWLHENLPGKVNAILNFFDFLTAPVKRERPSGHTVAFAGNLEESDFLQKLPPVFPVTGQTKIYLYGKPAPSPAIFSSSIEYKGAIEPYALPAAIEGSWGLVWDGDEADRIEGSFGHYMQYISHHKVSLYIMARMPIVTYEHAGTAYLVKEHQIGVTIKDLTELEEVLARVTPEAYRIMCHNTEKLATSIAAGNGLRRVLHEIMEIINTAGEHHRKKYS